MAKLLLDHRADVAAAQNISKQWCHCCCVLGTRRIFKIISFFQNFKRTHHRSQQIRTNPDGGFRHRNVTFAKISPSDHLRQGSQW